MMGYRAIYAYPWDLADEGVVDVIREVSALGIDTMTIAGSYHAGGLTAGNIVMARELTLEDL